MSPFRLIQNIFLKGTLVTRDPIILPIKEQIKTWRRANQKMGWGIVNEDFVRLDASLPPHLTDDDRMNGFIGSVLFYGFGDYALRRLKTWQCEYVNFNRPQDIRLRPGAPARPQGFYLTKVTFGEKFLKLTVTQVRKKLEIDTGWGPEGFQFLAITHPHFADLMNERKLPFMALADYDIAPHGYNDFYDAPQLFCSNSKLGLGIGNVDRNYPLFGIPILRFANGHQTPKSF